MASSLVQQRQKISPFFFSLHYGSGSFSFLVLLGVEGGLLLFPGLLWAKRNVLPNTDRLCLLAAFWDLFAFYRLFFPV